MRAENEQTKPPAPFVLAPQRAGGEPYTTSEIIAAGTGIDRRKVRDAIRKYKTDLETFGKVASYQARRIYDLCQEHRKGCGLHRAGEEDYRQGKRRTNIGGKAMETRAK